MMLATWIAVTVLALAVSAAAAVFGERYFIAWLAAAILWFVGAIGSAEIEVLVTYAASDYLKTFSYPHITLLFFLFTVLCALNFGSRFIEYSEEIL